MDSAALCQTSQHQSHDCSEVFVYARRRRIDSSQGGMPSPRRISLGHLLPWRSARRLSRARSSITRNFKSIEASSARTPRATNRGGTPLMSDEKKAPAARYLGGGVNDVAPPDNKRSVRNQHLSKRLHAAGWRPVLEALIDIESGRPARCGAGGFRSNTEQHLSPCRRQLLRPDTPHH